MYTGCPHFPLFQPEDMENVFTFINILQNPYIYIYDKLAYAMQSHLVMIRCDLEHAERFNHIISTGSGWQVGF